MAHRDSTVLGAMLWAAERARHAERARKITAKATRLVEEWRALDETRVRRVMSEITCHDPTCRDEQHGNDLDLARRLLRELAR